MKLDPQVALVGLKRTFIGKFGGALAGVLPHELLADCFKSSLAALAPSRLPLAALSDVVVGNVRNSIGNIARVASLEAGVPDQVPAMTVDRQCASGLEAVAVAACRVFAGLADVVLCGGVESASRCPWLFEKTRRPFDYFEPKPFEILMAPKSTGNLPMGETAEILADELRITREAMDEFAAASHRKASEAARDGVFNDEICALAAIEKDECVRSDTTPKSLASLRPVFRKDGRLTAGNSSPLNDGAASCLVMRRDRAEALGIVPDALLSGLDTVGLDPNRMGLGPALSIPRLLADVGRSADEVELFEINEAFSSQVLAVLAHLESQSGIRIPEEKLNVHGGAIALGHPLGATGLRLLVTLAHALKRHGLARGMVSMCVGGGQGMSALLERPV